MFLNNTGSISNKRKIDIRGKIIPLPFMLFFLAFSFFSCINDDGGRNVDEELSGSISVSGAGTTLIVLESLCEEFHKKHPEVFFHILPSSHTTGGIEGTRDGIIDIGAVSRELSPSETKHDLEVYYFCRDTILFITHPDVSVKSLTKNQLFDIYQGKITNWREVGGNSGKVIAIKRPETAGSMVVLKESFFTPDFIFSPDVVSIESSTDAISAVCQTKNTILFITSSFALSKKYPVKVLRIEDLPISNRENIISGKYPLTRPLGVVYRKYAPPHISAFIEYLHGEKAGDLILKQGCVPLP